MFGEVLVESLIMSFSSVNLAIDVVSISGKMNTRFAARLGASSPSTVKEGTEAINHDPKWGKKVPFVSED